MALVVHGIGDHSSADILEDAARGGAAIWGDGASSREIEIEGLSLPDEVNVPAFGNRLPVALEVTVAQERHIVLPIVWSGVRRRAARMAGRAEGPMALWVSLPLIAMTCIDLLRCAVPARGAWKLGVVALSLSISSLMAGLGYGVFYISVHGPLWLGSPFNLRWYSGLVFLACFAGLSFLIVRTATFLDLVGDVAWYVSHDRDRMLNIEQMRRLIASVAGLSGGARLVIVGHSLGSVLISQSLAGMADGFAAVHRTLAITIGSPLVLMSRVFPRQIETPNELAGRYATSAGRVQWANFWRTEDPIGQAFSIQHAGFNEASLGTGGHARYWSDERLWIAVTTLLRTETLPGSEALSAAWRARPLTESETERLQRIHQRLRELRLRDWGMLICGLFFQVSYLVRWENQFGFLGHALIWVCWASPLFLLAAVPTLSMQRIASVTSPRERLHAARYYLQRDEIISLICMAILIVISGVCLRSLGLW